MCFVFLIVIKSVELQNAMEKSQEINEEGFIPQVSFLGIFNFFFLPVKVQPM